MPLGWAQNKNSLFDRQMIISIISASAWAKIIFVHQQFEYFPMVSSPFPPVITASPLSYLTYL
jgi:hypothetical protein